MPVLARKINLAKWLREGSSPGEIDADAVTADLRTTSNTLSFWRCDSADAADLHRAVLALAAASDRPDKIDLVCLDEQDVTHAHLATKETPGQTPISDLRKHHVDIERLDLVRLCVVAELVASACRAGKSCRFPKSVVEALVGDAVVEKRVELSDLKEGLRAGVEKHLQRRGPR